MSDSGQEEVVSVKSRPLTDREQDILAWFEKQESESIANLEAGARQIITLITGFLGLLLGIISLGTDNLAAILTQAWLVWGSVATIVLLVLALGSALSVVLPRGYHYREARLDDMRRVYEQISGLKASWLRLATIFFGLGLTVLAVMIVGLLIARL